MDRFELEFTVACSPEHAFEVWATKTSLWWPPSHSVSGDPALMVTIEPRVGGRIFERTTDGSERDWGEVVVWEPPHRLGYLWHIYGDRSVATEVDITFTGDADTTAIAIAHRGWERLGVSGADLRERNRNAWADLLPRYQEACTRLRVI